ncbi:MAG: hypothetical protein H3C58_16265 [Fimbriimonadaceae bacterium]|nr:hypothetical protein [Fimbriimonadaceae bacterium]
MSHWWFARLKHAVPILGALLLVRVNLHLCAPRYELPGGATCIVCPTLDDEATDHGAEIGESHGDCHDCCVIAACHQSNPDSPATALHSWEHVVAAPVGGSVPVLVDTNGRGASPVHLKGCPPTGPPRSGRPRSPPSFSFA